MDMSEIEQRYQQLYPVYEAYASRLEELVATIAKREGIEVAHKEHRAKKVDSLLRKVTEKQCDDDPFGRILDLAGVRIVTHYVDEADRLAEVVRQQFDWDPDHSTDKLAELKPDEFGYRSIHVVVRLSEARRELPEWSDFGELWAEVQIRSVLQHAWASVSHKLDYRQSMEVPSELRRWLPRLSALLEVADLEFCLFRDRVGDIVEGYKQSVHLGELGIPLDLDSLTEYIRASGILQSAHAVGERAGAIVTADDPTTEGANPWARRTLQVLIALGAKTAADAADALNRALAAEDRAARLVAGWLDGHASSVHFSESCLLLYLVCLSSCEQLPKDFDWETIGVLAETATRMYEAAAVA